MLFILSGNVQCGKTRWLQGLIEELGAAGVAFDGVLAPGVWQERADEGGGASFRKLAIENVLLPQGERLTFGVWGGARGDGDPAGSQSRRARLAWDISDEAIGRVNAHLGRLASRAAEKARPGERRMLVVDELGRLELLHAGGLTAAMSLLDAGPTPRWPHALAVVRAELAGIARDRFAGPWRQVRTIGPDDDGRAAILSALRQIEGGCPL